MRLAKQLLGILATGYLLMFYSEFLFWARLRPGDSLSGWLSTWLAYSLLGFVCLTLIARFRVRSAWALFLVGAVFGWLAEGLVVQTAYDELPLSISFTGLAWHALITVWVGWYAVRRALLSGLRSTLILAGVIGLGYGFWAISWWVEPDGGLTHPVDFARYSLLMSLLLMLACWVYDRTVPASFKPHRIAEIAVAVLFLTVPASPLAIAILPVLLSAVYLALRHNQGLESRASLLDATGKADPAWRYIGLLALPLAASLFYAAAYALNLRWQTNWIVYLVTTPAGFILLVASFIKVWRMKPIAPAGT
jgi:hypothetical protein